MIEASPSGTAEAYLNRDSTTISHFRETFLSEFLAEWDGTDIPAD